MQSEHAAASRGALPNLMFGLTKTEAVEKFMLRPLGSMLVYATLAAVVVLLSSRKLA